MHIALFIKGIYWFQILLEILFYFIVFYLHSYFLDKQSESLIL